MPREADRGAATVELIALTLIVLVPVLYLIAALARVQAGVYAAEAAASLAARAAVVAGVDAASSGASAAASLRAAEAVAETSVSTTMEDFGIDPSRADLDLRCDGTCLAPGTRVEASVAVTVTLPGLPEAVLARMPLAVTLVGSASSPVDGFAP